MRFIIFLFCLFKTVLLSAQLIIYTDATTLITGIWDEFGTVSEVNSGSPFEGSFHYEFQYSYSQYWSGIGLNLDNWGNGPARDFSNYSHLKIAYRGLGSGDNMTIQFRDISGQSNVINIGGSVPDYREVEIPIISLLAGTAIDISQITEINISATSSSPSSSGTLFFDNIVLFNKVIHSGTSQQTWSRFQRMDKGFNFSNWLEAYWLMPFNTYPESNRFTRQTISDMVSLGFNSLRLPVTFERLAGLDAPYLMDTTKVEFDLIDSVIQWTNDFDLNLIITNHHGYELTDANYLSEIPRIQAVWSQILERYGSLDPDRFFFELSNEPTLTISNPNFKVVADSLISTIRTLGSDHTLILGGNGYNSAAGLVAITPYEDQNIIYTFHSYNPYFFTHQQMNWTDPPNLPTLPFPNSPSDSLDLDNEILSTREWSNLYKVPVMLGEFGVSSAAPSDSRCRYVNTVATALENYNIPWFYWDATSNSNAFGFIDGTNAVHCFAEYLKLDEFNTCELQVTKLNDYGPGTFRDQIACATSGDTITFAKHLNGDTIRINSPTIFLNKSLVIKQELGSTIPIMFSDPFPALDVCKGGTLILENILILQDENTASEALNIKGTIVTKNVNIQKE